MVQAVIRSLQQRWYAPGGYREVLTVGLPLVASMASTTVMQFTDRLFLSRYSVETIAAALPAGYTQMLFLLTFMGVTGYATVLIAQNIGAGKADRAGRFLWQAIWASLFFGFIMGCLSFVAKPIFALAGHDPVLRHLEEVYFSILCMGSFLALCGNSLSTFFSGQGYTRPVMLANMLAALVNIPLNYMFIYGKFGFPEMGIAGAALATACGWGVSLLMLARAAFTKKNELYYRVLSSWKIHWASMKMLLRYGLPSGINFFMELFAVTWFVFVIGTLGELSLAATNIAFSINSVAFLPVVGFNVAVSSMVGQAIGAGNAERAAFATQNTLHIAMCWMIALAILFVGTPGVLVDLFRPDALSATEYLPIRELTCLLLGFVALYCLFDSITIVYCGALKGAGDTFFVMYNMTFNCLFVLLLPAYVLKILGYWNLYSLWSLFTFYIICLAICSYWRFRQGKWRSMRLVHNDEMT